MKYAVTIKDYTQGVRYDFEIRKADSKFQAELYWIRYAYSHGYLGRHSHYKIESCAVDG